ncbi:MAG: hypothetical protein KA401_02715 [Anaerolineae bacterium]|nr:hypothetical protein [Anaerolineae bacterium]
MNGYDTYGYEYELERQRNKQMQAEAEIERILNHGANQKSSDILQFVGRQLIRLGTRLQGDSGQDHSTQAA